ncbi:MAG TPA: glutathione S-transferase C-terminal domain-containing protein [Frankiaceae bacterium]|nr:glutathione S-transferase C-terminal domain-containing protein [Frankiaceae bacterium]
MSPETAQFGRETAGSGQFVRQANRFRDRITADGSSGYPVEADRYQLYVSLACPWAQRTLIVRELLGLRDVLPVTVVDPIRDEKGWRFTLAPDGRDPVTGARYLSELYTASDPGFDGRWTVPMIWDRKTERLITNDFPQITLDLSTEWTSLHAAGAPDLYPAPLRAEMDELIGEIFSDVNNGVYRAGFATSQQAYGEAYDGLFARLDVLEQRLTDQRYLMGDRLTEVDIRLWTTLARFDAVYYSHFKCNQRRLVDYPELWDFARHLNQEPAFRETTDFDHIKRHYYCTHDKLNPSRIVPKGPDVDWLAPTRR